MEKHIFFLSDGNSLEGLLESNDSGKGVVITHPHPLYGGDMQNPVVSVITAAYKKKGYGTLKFNFRGVGESRGDYDNGMGESNDLQAAISFMADSGFTRLDLAGYSFGAWVISTMTSIPPAVKNIILVSPPSGMMAFSHTPAMDLVKGIITGEEDSIAPASNIRQLLQEFKSPAGLEIIPGADHFYTGCSERLESRLLSLI